MGKLIDETGNRYGRLIVLEEAGRDRFGNTLWLCQCECGNTIVVQGASLRAKRTQSCGCLRGEKGKLNLKGHRYRLPKGEAAFRSLLRIMKSNAKIRNLEWALADEEVKDLIQRPCYYCGGAPVLKVPTMQKRYNGYFLANGLDRLDNQKGYVKENVVPCCKFCNAAKSTLTISEFRDHIEKIYRYFIEPK